MRGVDLHAAVRRPRSAASVRAVGLRRSPVHSPSIGTAGHQRMGAFRSEVVLLP